MGRSRREKPLRQVTVRLEEDDYQRWASEAAKTGVLLPEWIRRMVDREDIPPRETPKPAEVEVSRVAKPEQFTNPGVRENVGLLPEFGRKKSYEPDPRPSQRNK